MNRPRASPAIAVRIQKTTSDRSRWICPACKTLATAARTDFPPSTTSTGPVQSGGDSVKRGTGDAGEKTKKAEEKG